MIRLTTLENRFEADLITETLTVEGIDFILRTYEDTAYDGLFVTQKGYGVLLVNEEDETMALDLVREIRASIEEE